MTDRHPNPPEFWPHPGGTLPERNPPKCVRCSDVGELMNMVTGETFPCPECKRPKR